MGKNFEHLILLIGTNPLPNFVVADYFLQENKSLKKIWLIYSESNDKQNGTHEQAENLEKLIRARGTNHPNLSFPLEKISLSDVSNAVHIRNDIRKLTDKLASSESFHLNYTGGTKSMSTHVYSDIREFAKDDTAFSYLDGRNFRLISDEGDILERDLRERVRLSFEELIALHGFERKFERKNEPTDFLFPDALEVFRQHIEDDRLEKFYDKTTGYNRGLFLDKKGELAKEVGKLSKKSKDRLASFSPNDEFQAVVQNMPEEYRLFDSDGNFQNDLQNEKFKAAVKFLDGLWLENYVYKVLGSIFDESINLEQNWVIKKSDWGGDLKFELDVILVHGYQLIGISCTTSSQKGRCKGKGFEIIHRTRQIGGDEAKAVILTYMDDTKVGLVQDELEVHTGGSRKNILALGKEDLKKEVLSGAIKKLVLDD